MIQLMSWQEQGGNKAWCFAYKLIRHLTPTDNMLLTGHLLCTPNLTIRWDMCTVRDQSCVPPFLMLWSLKVIHRYDVRYMYANEKNSSAFLPLKSLHIFNIPNKNHLGTWRMTQLLSLTVLLPWVLKDKYSTDAIADTCLDSCYIRTNLGLTMGSESLAMNWQW